MTYKHKLLTISILIIITLSACKGPTATASPTADLNAIGTQAINTVIAQLTQTAAAVTSTPTITSTPTLTPEANNTSQTQNAPLVEATNTSLPTDLFSTPLGTPVASLTPVPTTASGGGTIYNCDNSQWVSDVSIPDGTNFYIGESFVKTWGIKNTGDCTWTKDYKLVFGYSSPDNPDWAYLTGTLDSEVKPGETGLVSVTVTLPNVVPAEAGYYAAFRLANDRGYAFGAWVSFYVKMYGPTPTPTP
jgi:Ig-like domain-containing protein